MLGEAGATERHPTRGVGRGRPARPAVVRAFAVSEGEEAAGLNVDGLRRGPLEADGSFGHQLDDPAAGPRTRGVVVPVAGARRVAALAVGTESPPHRSGRRRRSRVGGRKWIGRHPWTLAGGPAGVKRAQAASLCGEPDEDHPPAARVDAAPVARLPGVDRRALRTAQPPRAAAHAGRVPRDDLRTAAASRLAAGHLRRWRAGAGHEARPAGVAGRHAPTAGQALRPADGAAGSGARLPASARWAASATSTWAGRR